MGTTTGTRARPDRSGGRGDSSPRGPAASGRRWHGVAARILRCALTFAAIAAPLAGLSGCYKRVVGVKGDAYQGPVYEANLAPGERNLVVELLEVRTTRTTSGPPR
jgi:hypothetical protein